MEEWRFVFEDNTDQNNGIDSGVTDVLGSGAGEKSKKSGSNKKGFSEVAQSKATEKLFEQTIISPLNTITGGFANPIYKTSKRLISGATTGAVLGTFAVNVGFMVIQKGIDALQQRMANLEKQATSMNNQDNALLRAGSVSHATYYSANLFSGVKKTTNRR